MAVPIMTSMSVRPSITMPIDDAPPTAPMRAVMSPWRWFVVTCLLVAIPAGIRFWREWRFAVLATQGEACPFSLAQLPPSIGKWRFDPSAQTTLDPEVALFAGASDHVVRNYVEAQTGDPAVALIVYGLGVNVSLHVPDICYPAAGYQAVKGPIDQSITVPGVKEPVRYRWAIYTKQVGGINRYEESYCTFEHGGVWKPDLSDRWKMFRYIPGVFKVQIGRPVSGLSENGEGPGEDLLKELVRQINDRLPPAGKAKG
jgi:hypothetical protein